ncbi:DDB1- and CUL4-associated factor 6-like [Biomphalaria glabrata]|uniref:DDB1- and CUL4-associated factor 6-like n=1 Tax=Biomphalaria glabrata TaxID=6526 RepID=A0A9W3AM65_BIOGL|nr:DDB1- and CUL4-associated factor 6-like [Biomphalaria glabrata]
MFSLLRDREHYGKNTRLLYNAATESEHFLQRLKLEKKLKVHDGCVNTICWNDACTLILSGSDDQHLAITDPFSGKSVVKFRSGHRSNIFSAKFLPGSVDREVVSCSGSGEIFYTDVDREDTYGANRFDCHFGTTYKLLVVPNEAATFLSCGDDGTVRFFDLRMKTNCSKFNCEEDIIIHLRNAVTAMAVDPLIPFQLAVASSDGIVRLYDRRMLKARELGVSTDSLICKFPPPMTTAEKRHYRITSLNYRPGSHDVLVNYSSENIYLFNTYDMNKKQCFSSHVDPNDVAGCSKDSQGGTYPDSPENASASLDNGSDNESAFKPIKRLRLRGDWSDTGPDARPESEEPALTNTIMQRMSDLLTRMLNSRNETNENQEEAQVEGAAVDNHETVVRQETAEMDTAEPYIIDSEVQAYHSVLITPALSSDQVVGAHPSERHSISSEGLVSPELLCQELESHSELMITTREENSGSGQGADLPDDSLSDYASSRFDPSQAAHEGDVSSLNSSVTLVDTKEDLHSEKTYIEERNSCTSLTHDSDKKLAAGNLDSNVSEPLPRVDHDSLLQKMSLSTTKASADINLYVCCDSADFKLNDDVRTLEAASDTNLEAAGATNSTLELPHSLGVDVCAQHIPVRRSSASIYLSHYNLVPSVDMNSESNDSISDQMSSNLHIVQGQPSCLSAQQGTSSKATTEDSSSELVPSSSLSTPPANVVYHAETSSIQPRVLSSNMSGLRNKRKEIRSWTSHTIVSPTAGGTFTPRRTSSENSVHSYSLSSSDSPVAIAERDLSGYEGNLSQQTLNDISAFSSMLNLTNSFTTPISEVTPTVLHSLDPVKDSPNIESSAPRVTVSWLDQVSSQKQAESTHAMESTNSGESPTPNIGANETCPATSTCDAQSDTQTNLMISGVCTTALKLEIKDSFRSSTCTSCGIDIAFNKETGFSESHPSSLCKKCCLLSQASTSKNIALNKDAVRGKLETLAEQSNTSLEEFSKNASIQNSSSEFPEPSSSHNSVKKSSKGKGKGKSSLKAQKSSCKAEKFAPYNSGKMRISPMLTDTTHSYPSLSDPSAISPSLSPESPLVSVLGPEQYQVKDSTGTVISRDSELSSNVEDNASAAPDDGDEAIQDQPPKALYRLPCLKSCPQGFERQRRIGYSLPPTGSFQLHSDDDVEGHDEDEDDEESGIRTRLKSENKDMSKAALKIQELYRKKRDAREMAKMRDVPQPRMLMKYSGHRNCRTMIKEANFYGDRYVISGSDCGRLLVWERESGRMVMYLDADRHVVNCVQPNLYLPVIASSGIDYDIKIWSPLEEDAQFDLNKAEMIIRRNELMLEETRDTVTVPAAFMLRILASLSQIRTGRNSARQGQPAPPDV